MEKVAEAINKVIENALGISALELLMNVLATILLLLVVRFLFWNKVTNFIEKRKKIITNELEDAKIAKTAALDLKEKADSELKEIRENASNIIKEAQDIGLMTKEKIIQEANIAAEKIILEGNLEVDKQIKVATQEIKAYSVEIAKELAEKVLNQEIDDDKFNNQIIDRIGESDE